MLHILTPEYPPQVGGVADYTRLVARALQRAGEDIHVWTRAAGSGIPEDGIAVHGCLGNFGGQDLDRVSDELDAFPAPRRLLIQWVPHGFGFNAMNVPFCLWLWQRAAKGDHVELMVHEPYLAFWEGSWRQTVAAAVHRVMTTILLRAADRVWISIPAWAAMWSPYRIGRPVPFAWLPIPSSLPDVDPSTARGVRARLSNGYPFVIGHLGTYGSLVTSLLEKVLPRIADTVPDAQLVLLGEGSLDFQKKVIESSSFPAARMTAAGFLDDASLAAHVAACDVMVQPYPDGITSRRTSAMAALKLGIPLVTTRGHFTERLWSDASGVMIAQVGDADALASHVKVLAESAERRRQLGNTGRELYKQFFDLRYTVEALKTAASERAT